MFCLLWRFRGNGSVSLACEFYVDVDCKLKKKNICEHFQENVDEEFKNLLAAFPSLLPNIY